MRNEQGMTFVSLLIFLVLLGIPVMVLMKVFPAYYDYYSVQSSLENTINNSEHTESALRGSFAKRLSVNMVKDITEKDLDISKEGDVLTLSVPIYRKESLGGGLFIVVDLEAKASGTLK